VLEEGRVHMRAIQVGKRIVEAAQQSAWQYKSTRDALRKARLEEERATDREEKKRQKAAEAEAARKKKEAERLAKKQEKELDRQRKKKEAAEQEAQEDQAQDGDDQNGAGARRRRGKGAQELTDSDHPVLANRFSGHEVPVVDTMPKFIPACLKCDPVIWRARRRQTKKILEEGGLGGKTALNTNCMLQAELKTFISEAATTFESDATRVKITKAMSEQAQQSALDPLSLELPFTRKLEEEADDQAAAEDREPCLLIEREVLTQALLKCKEQAAADEAEADEASIKTAKIRTHTAKQDLFHFSKLQMVGFKKTGTFSGVVSGLFPHLVYQSEGTRAMAMVNIYDVA
ncbi:unnamed protein product, partial [Durusdinium trenchii]